VESSTLRAIFFSMSKAIRLTLIILPIFKQLKLYKSNSFKSFKTKYQRIYVNYILYLIWTSYLLFSSRLKITNITTFHQVFLLLFLLLILLIILLLLLLLLNFQVQWIQRGCLIQLIFFPVILNLSMRVLLFFPVLNGFQNYK